MSEVPYQTVTVFVCLVSIFLWFYIGRHTVVGWYAALPASAALITLIYYLLALLTDWNETDLASFLMWGAIIRLYTFLIFLVAGLVMLKRVDHD